MLLYTLPLEAKKQKEIFRPLDDTYPEIARVDSLIHKWLKSSPMNSDVEVVLEKKSPTSGDGYGVGAVWSAWVAVQIPKKHHTDITKVKKVFEVKAIIPNRQLVLEITVDQNHSPGSCWRDCFRVKNKMPPAVLMFTAVDKGKSTEVSAQLNTAYPSMCKLFPKQILLCPCIWPHLLLFGLFAVICCPCCHGCAKSMGEQSLLNECDRGAPPHVHTFLFKHTHTCTQPPFPLSGYSIDNLRHIS